MHGVHQCDLSGIDVLEGIVRLYRSGGGDVYLVQEQYWWLYTTEELPTACMHGSPWVYDTYVPIIFAGSGVPARTIHRRGSPYDIAATLSARLEIKPPSGSVGTPLVEVLGER